MGIRTHNEISCLRAFNNFIIYLRKSLCCCMLYITEIDTYTDCSSTFANRLMYAASSQHYCFYISGNWQSCSEEDYIEGWLHYVQTAGLHTHITLLFTVFLIATYIIYIVVWITIYIFIIVYTILETNMLTIMTWRHMKLQNNSTYVEIKWDIVV